jgi:hypothetical protein
MVCSQENFEDSPHSPTCGATIAGLQHPGRTLYTKPIIHTRPTERASHLAPVTHMSTPPIDCTTMSFIV